jgi:hypothetical protein
LPRKKRNSKKVTITRVEKARSAYGGLRVHFKLGRTRLSVCVESEDFSERNLKKAIAAEIASEFAFRYARSMVGKSFLIEEIAREYPQEKNLFNLF